MAAIWSLTVLLVSEIVCCCRIKYIKTIYHHILTGVSIYKCSFWIKWIKLLALLFPFYHEVAFDVNPVEFSYLFQIKSENQEYYTVTSFMSSLGFYLIFDIVSFLIYNDQLFTDHYTKKNIGDGPLKQKEFFNILPIWLEKAFWWYICYLY